MEDLPYRVEYAKSNRSSCKGCKEKIEKDHLRLAVMVQSSVFDGRVPNWYHFSCFFGKQRPKSVGDFSHFESIRWEDQKKLEAKIGSGATDVTDSLAKGSKKTTTKRKQSKASSSGNDFCVEYSKSSRAVCRGCEEKIIKNDVRAAKKDFDSEEGRLYGGINLWHHLDCFAKLRADLEFWESGTKLPGYKTLTKEDQIKVKELLPEMKPIKKEEEAEPKKKPKLENDTVIKKQNKLIFQYRDALKDLPKKFLTSLLEYNDQQIPSGIDSMLDRLADGMVFGALLPCEECKNGQMVFRSGIGYFCMGNKDDWVKCEKVYEEPKRKPFRIPEEIMEEYPFFQTYKYVPQKRVFQNIIPSVQVSSSSFSSITKSTKSEPNAGPKISRHVPLKNMEFAVVGKLDRSKEETKLEIMKLGGKLSAKIHENTVAVISTPGMLKKMGVLMERAKELNIQVVPESFIDECKNGGDAITIIVKMNFAPWGSDPSSRISADVVDFKSKSHSNKYKSNAPTKIKLKVKDGVAVDPDSGLEDVAHVYREGSEIYNAALSLTDLQSGKNSYYKIQVLQSTKGQSYWLFRSWGRIGTTIGGTKTESMTKEKAIEMFKFYFEGKTANMWDNREHFRKVPGKMIMMDICYEEEVASENGKLEIQSTLEKPVQDLVSLIFNVSAMKNVMLEMELDTEKMPLGKLSKKQIQEAFKILTKLQDCIVKVKGELDTKQIISYTNQFFTLIPHDFGVDNPPLLNDLELIKQKSDMLDTLLEIEIAYSMVKSSSGTAGSHIDTYYMKLNADIKVLDKASPEFKNLELYVKNTHAETHRNYDLEIIEVFKVQRSGELKRFKPFKKLNRKLLWHGSRLTNFAGILSQGLRIAPPEAPVTGYMFGKGIYFADMVSKSANYCLTSPANNTGILMLCEVAVGDSLELLAAENITKLPKGKHSVKGLGKTHPDPAASITTEDGVEIPLGKGVPSKVNNTSLLYNEYIVYDVAQVKVQYLCQVKFNYTCF